MLVLVALEPLLEPLEPRAVAVAQALDDVVGLIALDLLQPLERRLGDPLARLGVDAPVLLGLLQPEPAQQRRERQPGDHQREHDHGIGDEDRPGRASGSPRS